MFGKFKHFMNSRSIYNKVNHANDYNVIKPFLLGCQIEYRRFGNYIFVKNNSVNEKSLTQRHFVDFKKTITPTVNWELNDSIIDFGDSIMYNDKYNIMIVMVQEKYWSVLNTSIDIAQDTDKDILTQRDIVISAFNTLKT